MNIEILFKNGQIDEWPESKYTDYSYRDGLFIVINGFQWVGIYNMDTVQKIVISD